MPSCLSTQLVPQLGAAMFNQGVASYADGSRLVRGKDTLVRFFLTNPSIVGSSCAGTIYVRSASLSVTNGGASYAVPAALQTFGTSGTAIPASSVSVDSNADPKFVVPAANANSCLNSPCADTAAFTLTFTATISYSTNLVTTPVSLTLPVATANFDRGSNALRILAIPMGDQSQTYSTQFSDSARVAVENGFAALSRIYPVPGGVSSTLNTTSGGIRYKLDLAAMLNLRAVTGAYDGNNKFCGTQANFDGGIKSRLAGFLSVYNSSITDMNQRADRVMGVVDKAISDGSTSTFNCAEAMASTNSPETWVRAIPDVTGRTPVPSTTGALMAMELAHTFGLEAGTLTFHSPNTQADGTAPDKAYNLSSRSYLADDRSTMRFVATNPFNNNNALFEKDDYARMQCNLGGSVGTCTTATTTGTTSVAAGPTFAIFGTTDFTPGGTHVLESYESENDPHFENTSGDLTLQFSNGSTLVKEIAVPYSTKTSEHDAAQNLNTTTAVFGGIFAAEGYDTVRLVHNGTTLYERSSANLEPVSAGIGDVGPGGTLTIAKKLTTPEIPPKPDVLFLSDTTSSMTGAIGNVKANVASIITQVRAAQSDAQFGVASYRDFGETCGPAYQLDKAVTADTTAVQTAVGTWTASGGCDIPEAQLNALYHLATDSAVGWRSGSSRIVVWIGDAPGHDPSGDASSIASVISALKATGIRVIAINVGNLDGTEQATQIVNATGGVLKATSDPAQVTPAILAGLTNLPATVTHEVTSCAPDLSVAFDAESKTVTSGDPVSFTETVGISASATPGSTLTCTVHFLVNGLATGDSAFTQTISIKVADGTALVATFETANVANLRAHVVYDCGNGEKEPAFVGLDATQVATNVAQFQQNVDPSLACADASGTASLTIVGTNGLDAVSQTVPTSPSTLPVADKKPSAAIYQPTADATIPYTSPFSLNGHVADPEDGNLDAHWTLVSGPASFPDQTGDVVDVVPPDGGWPAGDYVIRLSGTDLSNEPDHTATATVTVHVARYTFAGFFQPVDNPPVLNAGRTGKTYPLKWSLTQNGTQVTDLSAVVALRFAGAPCGTAPTDVLETTLTGATQLRYDATAQQYVYNWQTPSAPGCYVVMLTLADGSTWPAYFKLN